MHQSTTTKIPAGALFRLAKVVIMAGWIDLRQR